MYCKGNVRVPVVCKEKEVPRYRFNSSKEVGVLGRECQHAR